MSALQEYHGVIGQPTPILTYRNDQDFPLHWDGALFALLCLASWVLFAYLWARMHWLNYLEGQKPPPLPPQNVEDWISSKHWRN